MIFKKQVPLSTSHKKGSVGVMTYYIQGVEDTYVRSTIAFFPDKKLKFAI